MILLLDTHVLVWVLTDDPRLGSESRVAIAAAEEVRVSAASWWELGIKHGLGRFPDPSPLLEAADRAGLVEAPVLPGHGLAVARCPLAHRDPFGRLLVAQASVEEWVLLTADEHILAAGLPAVVDARE